MTAADELGFAVPCPTRVPTLEGRATTCPVRQPASAATPCVGREGLVGYPIFALEYTGFDVPPGYIGVDGKAVGHIVVEARPHRDSPPLPCIGATALAKVRLGQQTLAEFSCPNDSLRVQREARHGEGAYAGHLVVAWTVAGIDYLASAHGATTANLDLLKRLVRSMQLIGPRPP
jgi:hypothetical protein